MIAYCRIMIAVSSYKKLPAMQQYTTSMNFGISSANARQGQQSNGKGILSVPGNRYEVSMLLIRAFVFAIVTLPSLANAASLSKDYINLLNGEAYIHYIKVAVPGDLYVISGKEGKGWVYYEGAFQGDTFWIRNCTNSIPGSGPMTPGNTMGASYSENWYGKPDGYVAKSPKAGKSQEPTDKLVGDALKMIRQAFGLGLVIKPGSLRVSEDNSFTALSDDVGTITGRFVVSEDGRAQKCTYTMSLFPKASAVVNFEYSDTKTNSTLPSSFTCKTQVTPLNPLMVGKETYQIIDCQFGKDTVPDGGFTQKTAYPEVHLPPESIYNNQMVFSNGDSYQQAPDGTLTHVKKLAVGLSGIQRASCFAFIVINLIAFSWLIRRSMSNKNTKTGVE